MPAPDVPAVTPARAVAFRVAAHGLDRRRSDASPRSLGAASAVALSDYPRGAAGRALAARCSGVRADTLARALVRGTLVRAFSLRGAAHVFAAADAGLFTGAVLPTPGDEAAAQAALGSSWPMLSRLGVPAVDVLAQVGEAVGKVAADGRPRAKGDLSSALHGRLPDGWEPWCERCRAHHVPDLLFRLAVVAAGLRFADDGPSLVPGPVPSPADHPAARAELVRRFLGAYAPIPAKAFAEWCGVGPAEASASFAALGDEVVEVRVGRARASVRSVDLSDLTSGPAGAAADGVRLVPAGDPFLQQRDRATLVPDADRRRRLWRPAGAPGLVLVDGAPAGVWRHKQDKGTTVVTVEPWSPADDGLVATVRDEAAAVLTVDRADVRVDLDPASNGAS